MWYSSENGNQSEYWQLNWSGEKALRKKYRYRRQPNITDESAERAEIKTNLFVSQMQINIQLTHYIRITLQVWSHALLAVFFFWVEFNRFVSHCLFSLFVFFSFSCAGKRIMKHQSTPVWCVRSKWKIEARISDTTMATRAPRSSISSARPVRKHSHMKNSSKNTVHCTIWKWPNCARIVS